MGRRVLFWPALHAARARVVAFLIGTLPRKRENQCAAYLPDPGDPRCNGPGCRTGDEFSRRPVCESILRFAFQLPDELRPIGFTKRSVLPLRQSTLSKRSDRAARQRVRSLVHFHRQSGRRLRADHDHLGSQCNGRGVDRFIARLSSAFTQYIDLAKTGSTEHRNQRGWLARSACSQGHVKVPPVVISLRIRISTKTRGAPERFLKYSRRVVSKISKKADRH